MRSPENSYFFLASDCFLVFGALNAAIYQLSTGDVYSVDYLARMILELAEGGVCISAFPKHSDLLPDESEILSFLYKLESLELGMFSDRPEKPPKIALPVYPFHLEKVWLELTPRCNLACIHCYADSSPHRSTSTLSLQQWQMAISEAASLGTQWIQFIGGEPLLYGKHNLFELILTANQAQIPFIEVFTNGTLLDDEYVEFFAAHNVHVALSIYSKRPEIHDKVTQSSGSFRRLMKHTEMLQQRGVPFRFGLILMSQNCEFEEETLTWIRSNFSESSVSCDMVRCTQGGRDGSLALLTPILWKRRLRSRPTFPKVTLEGFVRSKGGHPCFAGEICLQASGDVYPCIMERGQVLGNVTVSLLKEIIEGAAAQSIWGLSKDRILVCKDCEYRYACFDCRPLAIAITQELEHAQPDMISSDPCCLYDPYTGNWKNESEFINRIALIENEKHLAKTEI